MVVEDADVDETAQEEVSAGETAAATTTDHQYSMRPEQQPVNEEEASVNITNGIPNEQIQQRRATAIENIVWGNLKGLEAIKLKVQHIHSEIMAWKKNIMVVPTSKAGKDFIAEVRLLRLFNLNTNMVISSNQSSDHFLPTHATETFSTIQASRSY